MYPEQILDDNHKQRFPTQISKPFIMLSIEGEGFS